MIYLEFLKGKTNPSHTTDSTALPVFLVFDDMLFLVRLESMQMPLD
jgi:hypothetical protein